MVVAAAGEFGAEIETWSAEGAGFEDPHLLIASPSLITQAGLDHFCSAALVCGVF